MRKAAWGAIALAVWALSFGSPIRELLVLHQILGVLLLVGYLLLSFDPPERTKLQSELMIAGVVCGIASFLLVVLLSPHLGIVVARILAVAVVALPLWQAAGPARYSFVAAAALALATGFMSGLYATSLHAYAAALSAFWVAATLHNPALFIPGEKKPKRVVVASNIVTLSVEEKAATLARLEKRFHDGEIPEHVYLDKKQELDSR